VKVTTIRSRPGSPWGESTAADAVVGSVVFDYRVLVGDRPLVVDAAADAGGVLYDLAINQRELGTAEDTAAVEALVVDAAPAVVLVAVAALLR
jgi:hypothetical protein